MIRQEITRRNRTGIDLWRRITGGQMQRHDMAQEEAARRDTLIHETWHHRDDKRWHDKRGPIPRHGTAVVSRHDMTSHWHSEIWHEWHEKRWHHMARYDMTWHDMTRNRLTWHGMARQDRTWEEMTSTRHSMTWPDRSHDTARRDTRWQEVTYMNWQEVTSPWHQQKWQTHDTRRDDKHMARG